jgi:hypothetical protein
VKKFALLLVIVLPTLSFADVQSVQSNLQEAIAARYRITLVGNSVLGLKGGPDSIRKLGGTMLVVKKGMFGAMDRANITSNSINNGERTLLAGKEDIALLPGDRFYVNSVSVGRDFVAVGLLSVDPKSFQGRSARVWASVNFFFPPDTISGGDLKKINAVMDQWILPADATPNMPANPVKTYTSSAELPPTVDLTPGMTREEVVAGLGTPAQTINFGNRAWMTYPALVVALENGKLSSVDRAEDSAGRISVTSDPAGAEVYVDGELAGSTPATLRIPVGAHHVELKSQGRSAWQQDVRVFPGAELKLAPTLGTASGN